MDKFFDKYFKVILGGVIVIALLLTGIMIAIGVGLIGLLF